MPRRVVFYGNLSIKAKRKLVSKYGVQIVLDAPALQKWMVMEEGALRSAEYDLLVVDSAAPKANDVATVVRTERGIQAVTVRSDEGESAVIQAVLDATGWTPMNTSAFAVITSTKGGVGKSTLVVALAVILSQERGKKVLVVDDNPNQANVSHLLTGKSVAPLMVDEMTHSAEAIRSRIVGIFPGLDLLTPEEYSSRTGVQHGTARMFWQTVATLGYDCVLVDTSPSFGTPDNPDEWTDVCLAFSLITDGSLRSAFVVPFTPVEWGHEGLNKTRELLARWHRLETAIPVVVLFNNEMIPENVPDWLRNDNEGWGRRLKVVAYNHRVHGNARTLWSKKTWLYDARKPYREIADAVEAMISGGDLDGETHD